jgi:hypothetical protein
MRILLLLISFGLMTSGFGMAKEAPRTMATRKVMSAKAFGAKRAKAMETAPKSKKIKSQKNRKHAKAAWGANKGR